MRFPLRSLQLVSLALVLASEVARAASPDAGRVAERVLWLLRGVDGEYAEAFDADGRLARPIELEEATLLLVEARDLAPAVGLSATDLARLERMMADHAPAAAVRDVVQSLSARVTAATGVVVQVLPPVPPSPERGGMLFQENCASCHGADGSGAGEEARRLGLAPANFRSAEFMRAETPDDFFNVVTLGRRRSGMPAWGEVLSVQDRWDLVRYAWTLAAPAPLVDRPVSLPAAGAAVPPPAALSRMTDGEIRRAVGVGADDAGWAVVSALRARAFDGLVASGPSATAPVSARTAGEAFAEVHDLLAAALAAERGGDARALGLATDAYMRFEPFEKRLGAVAPALVRRVEEGFVRLRQRIRDPNRAEASDALVAALHHDLGEAAAALEPGAGAWIRFVQSAGIILREGFEVVLVVGALVAYVRRRGDAAMVRALYGGSAAGLVASGVTAVALATVLRLTPWAGEAVEGAAMLLAAVTLFWVSYWLVSKAEADRWQRYLRGKVEGALSARSGFALAAAAFLAVYREGFETILFYQALFATAPPGDTMVAAGLAAGLLALAVVYVGLERVGLQIPIRAFFLGTGGFLYAMAIVFAGRGVAELQEAGLVSLTAVPWMPRVETLGVFPTLETLAAQAVFVLLLLYAVGVTLRRRALRPPTPAGTAPPGRIVEG